MGVHQMFRFFKKIEMVSESEALPGRAEAIPVIAPHFVSGRPLTGPFPEGLDQVQVGMGCFWGAERKFWTMQGVFTTAVGYGAGYTQNPTYKEVCSGLTGHNEVVLVVYDPTTLPFDMLLKTFWESHDPTQGMRQGNDTGTQYRSGIYTYNDDQFETAQASKRRFEAALNTQGYGNITTEIIPAGPFYYAEDYHQQYLAKNPGGYCGLGGTGVPCPTGLTTDITNEASLTDT
ncbi:MAG: peptide-methionine (S)-S-oxide reductase MsrA [Myxococcota bacterium]|nr:peptide-methionine (S)-S-oxide reductase MsrA [Myxococcota bacterium]